MTERGSSREGSSSFGRIRGGRNFLEGKNTAPVIPPVPSEAEIAEFCSPLIVREEDKWDANNRAILEILGTQDFLACLPSENPSAEYIDVSRRLRGFQELWRRQREIPSPPGRKLLTAAAQILVLAKRIAGWLESKYYPVIFARAVQEAKEDIWKFVFVKFNEIGLVPELDIRKSPVILRDKLTFALKDEFRPAVFNDDGLEVLVPEGDLTGETEWSVYVGTIYALLGQIFSRFVREERRNEINSLIIDFLVCKFAINKIHSKGRLKNSERVLPSIPDAEHSMAILKEVSAVLPEDLCVKAMTSDIALEEIRQALLGEPSTDSVEEEGGATLLNSLIIGMRDFRDRLWRAGFETIAKK